MPPQRAEICHAGTNAKLVATCGKILRSYSNSCVRTIVAVFLLVRLLKGCLHVILQLHALILERGNTYETDSTESCGENHDDPACELSDTLEGSVVLSIVQNFRILFFVGDRFNYLKNWRSGSLLVQFVCE